MASLCGITVWNRIVESLCGIAVWNRCVGLFCGVTVWDCSVRNRCVGLLCGIAVWAYVCHRCVQSVHRYRPVGGPLGGPSRSISREKTVPPHPERSITIEKCTKSKQNSDSAIRRPILTAFCNVKTHVPPPLAAPSSVLGADAVAREPHVFHMYLYFAQPFAQTPSQQSRPGRVSFPTGE